MSSNASNIRPYKLNGIECCTAAELAAAMADTPEAAAEHIDNEYVQNWFEQDLRDYDLKLEFEKLLKEYSGERALFEFALRNAPDWHPKIQGIPVDPKSLTDYFTQCLKDDYILRDPSITRLASKIFDWNVLTDERISKGDERLARIDRIWRLEFEAALLTRGEMLLYEGLYSVPGDDSDTQLVADRQVELAFAERALRDGDAVKANFALAANSVALACQSDLLAELLAADEIGEGFPSSYKVEKGFYYEDASHRPWFVDLLSKQQTRTAGREAGLRDAARIAASQTHALARQEEAAIENVQRDIAGIESKVTNSISKLDRWMQAALFGVPVLLIWLMHDGYSVDIWFWLGILSIALSIGMIPFRMFNTGKYRTTKSFFGSMVIALVIFSWFERDLSRSDFLYQALFAAGAGLAGYFREPMLAFRARSIERAARTRAVSRAAHSASRIELDRLRIKFFPELVMNIPREKRTMEDYELRAVLQYQAGVDHELTRYADPRSAVAPNNPDGVSANVGGINFSGDGTTFEVMDGVSMDTKGNWNMRVVDGLTLHSDGKTTASVTKGLDIRSDGQVSTEAAGFRFSFGGKDKKKDDEWDWGTGQKKEKGWFD